MAAPAPFRTAVAWTVIVGACAAMFMRTGLEPASGEEDAAGLVVTEIQSRYLLGAAEILPGEAGELYKQAETMLESGTVGQRQRFVVLAGELAGPDEARRQLEDLRRLIADPPQGEPVKLTERQATVDRILGELYGSEAAGSAGVSPADRRTLEEDLGWFGRLALSPQADGDTPQRRAVMATALRVAVTMFAAAGLAVGLVVAGLAALIILLILRAVLPGGRRFLRGGLDPGQAGHAVYAETFAIWFVLFIVLQEVAGRLAPPGGQLLYAGAGFPLSLTALAWPVLRGVPWRAVRRDVGLTLGSRPWVEPLVGLGGYVMTVPLLALGVLATLVLMLIQQALAPEQPTFTPGGGPTHPVITFLSGPDLWPKIQVLLLASVAAPVVEETMFRGVLYRHLRDATRWLAPIASVAVATLVNTFLFAVIHPQGFVAVPALMSLAIGMTLLREWRGTLVPSMVVHGLSNGLVMSMLWIVMA